MRFAYVGDKKISITEYRDEVGITCGEGHPVIAKRGTQKAHHFAHKASCSCSCSDGMTDWHIWWQDRAKKEYQEVRMKNDIGTLHIADTASNNYVIEYQHSPMDSLTMSERESFYTGLGYHLVWVFDTSSWEITKIKRTDTEIVFRMKRGSKFPMLGSYTGNVTKILDFNKSEVVVITKQSGVTLYGNILTLEEFDNKYLTGCMCIDNDYRPFHHSV